MAIVMGLDQHRAQITAEWMDTETGEVGRARVSPALPRRRAAVLDAVRRPAARGGAGGDDGLAVRGRGAARDRRRGPLAEPAETAARRGQQEARQDRPRRRAAPARAVDDRAAAGVLDPARAPARSARPGPAASHAGRSARRVAAAHPRGALSPRLPAAHGLLTAENRGWLEGLALPERARAGHRRAGDDRRARRAVGADHPRAASLRAPPGGLPRADGPLRHRRADRGRRSSPSSATRAASPPRATPSATPGWTSPSISPTSAAPPGTSPAKDRRRCAGRCSRPPRPRAGPAAPTAPTTTRPPSASAATAPASRSRASCSSAASTPCANSATRPCSPPDQPRCARCPSVTPMPRGRLPACCCRHHRVDGLQRPSGRNASRGNTPSTITSPTRRTARSRTEISPGARAHRTPPHHRAHDPPTHADVTANRLNRA